MRETKRNINSHMTRNEGKKYAMAVPAVLISLLMLFYPLSMYASPIIALDSRINRDFAIRINNDMAVYGEGVEGFISRLYELVLGREAEDEGYTYWTNQLSSNNCSAADVVDFFVFSDEFTRRNTTNEEYLNILFEGVMGREKDDGGYDYWLNMLQRGMTRKAVLNGFIESEEFSDICSLYGVIRGSLSMTNIVDRNVLQTMFVTRLYRNAMGREPDSDGLYFWVKDISEGNSAALVIRSFYESSEFKDMGLTNEEYLKNLYVTIMDREYDTKGFNYWMNEMNSGLTRNAVLHHFINSEEFAKLALSYGINRGEVPMEPVDCCPGLNMFVGDMYENLLMREGSDYEKAAWVSNIVLEHDIGTLISGFYESAEFKAITSSMSDEDYVKYIYDSILERQPTEAEINYLIECMTVHRASRAFPLYYVVASGEFDTRYTDLSGVSKEISPRENRDYSFAINAYVDDCYMIALGRLATVDELNIWSGSLYNKMPATTLCIALINADEFASVNPGEDGLIRAVYRMLLHRDAVSDEIDYWTNHLRLYGSGSLVSAMANSQECKDCCASIGINAYLPDGLCITDRGAIYSIGDEPVLGWQRLGDKRYFFDPNNYGLSAGGWRYVDGYKYFFYEDGSLCQDVSGIIGAQDSYNLIVDCAENVVVAYAKDSYGNYVVPVKSMICTTGASDCTIKGTFKIKRLGNWRVLQGNVYGQYCSQISGNYLFHSVWYYQPWNANSQSVAQYRKLGTQASHGCIRLTVADAKWIYDNCADSYVTIVSSGAYMPFDKPVPPPITAHSGDYGHDPTDIWS